MTEALIKIRQLQVLAKLKLNTELVRLSEISHEESVPLARLKAIAQEEMRHKDNGGFEISQAALSGMDTRWQIWAGREKRAIMSDLARIAQKREDQLIIAKHAFGRTEVLKTLESDAKSKR